MEEGPTHPNSTNAAREASRKVWRDFCAKLAEAGDTLIRPEAPASNLERAEGLHYITQVLRYGLIMNMEAADPDFPFFYKLVDEITQYGAPNPDNISWSATVKGDNEYRITGTRGTVFHFSLGAKAYRLHIDGSIASTGELTDKNMQWGPGGEFEIIASCKPQPGNWLRMEPDTNFLLLRQTLLDRHTEIPGTYKIERIDGPRAPAPLDHSFVEGALAKTANFVTGMINKFAEIQLPYLANIGQFTDLGQEFFWKAGGDPQLSYLNGYFRIAPDEAWVVDFVPPEDAVYWNFAIYNYWGQLLDQRYRPVGVNNHTARTNLDGSVTMVIAAKDVGIGNWLDTAGHCEGQAAFRGLKIAAVPEMRCRALKLADLAPKRF